MVHFNCATLIIDHHAPHDQHLFQHFSYNLLNTPCYRISVLHPYCHFQLTNHYSDMHLEVKRYWKLECFFFESGPSGRGRFDVKSPMYYSRASLKKPERMELHFVQKGTVCNRARAEVKLQETMTCPGFLTGKRYRADNLES